MNDQDGDDAPQVAPEPQEAKEINLKLISESMKMKCMLTKKNYTEWSFHIELMLKNANCWDNIIQEIDDSVELDKKKDQLVQLIILNNVSNELKPRLTYLPTAKDMWVELREHGIISLAAKC